MQQITGQIIFPARERERERDRKREREDRVMMATIGNSQRRRSNNGNQMITFGIVLMAMVTIIETERNGISICQWI